MTANAANPRIQSKILRVNRDRKTATLSSATSPGRGSSQPTLQLATHIQEPPLNGLPRPDEVADNSTPRDTLVNYLLCMDQRQTSITMEQNRRVADFERLKRQLTPLCHAPSTSRNRRGRSPRPFRSRSPRHLINVRSPSHDRRSPRR